MHFQVDPIDTSGNPWDRRVVAPKEICLINPPSPFLMDERVFPNLGILKIAAVLEKAGHNITVLDLNGLANFTAVLESYAQNSTDTVYAISSTTPQLPNVTEITRVLRAVAPKARIIFGGPHATLTHSAFKMEAKRNVQGRGTEAFQYLSSMFDVVCSGDGELAIFEALKEDAPAVVDGDDNHGNLFMTDTIYEHSPLPARHMIDLKSYHYKIEGAPATSLIAQLGCPFGCGFCGGRSSKSLRVVRNRSIQSIVDEIRFLHETYGYTGFMFYDDELNVNKEMAQLMRSLIDLQEELGVEFRLRGFVKSELFTEEQADVMYRAGFRWLLCGFEAASPRILTNIDKRAGLEDNTRAVEFAKKYGLKVKALMSVGHPGESVETIQSIRDWLIKVDVDDFDCTIITPYPGTPYYDLAVADPKREGVWTYTHAKTGDRLHAYSVDYTKTADYYKGVPDGGYRSYVFTDYLSPEELVSARDDLERDIRDKLNLPYAEAIESIKYEHSTGMGLPPRILRKNVRTD